MEASAYVSGRPHPRLAGLVLGYTGYRELSARPVRRREAPSGRCMLVLGLGPPIRLLGPAGPDVPTSFLAGMHDAPVITEFTGAQHGVQVDLTPLGVFTLLGRPMPELTNRAPRLDELGGARAGRAARAAGRRPRLGRALRPDRRRAAQRPGRRPGPGPMPRSPGPGAGWSAPAAGSGCASSPTGPGGAGGTCWSGSASQVGLAPKTAAPGAAVPAGGRTRSAPGTLADVAADCGYADHAHLVREFRALAGCTAHQYLAEWECSHSFKPGAARPRLRSAP